MTGPSAYVEWFVRTEHALLDVIDWYLATTPDPDEAKEWELDIQAAPVMVCADPVFDEVFRLANARPERQFVILPNNVGWTILADAYKSWPLLRDSACLVNAYLLSIEADERAQALAQKLAEFATRLSWYDVRPEEERLQVNPDSDGHWDRMEQLDRLLAEEAAEDSDNPRLLETHDDDEAD